jgi:hypothetical protein
MRAAGQAPDDRKEVRILDLRLQEALIQGEPDIQHEALNVIEIASRIRADSGGKQSKKCLKRTKLMMLIRKTKESLRTG